LFAGVTPPAHALEFYTDEAAWKQAVSNDGIEPYPGIANITRYQVTEQLFHDGTCCQPPINSTSVGVTAFTSLSGIFSSTFIDSGLPSTLDREIIIDFPIPIYGFAAYNVKLPDVTLDLNGRLIPSPKLGIDPFPFLGVTGEITSLDFLADGCPKCDDPFGNLSMSNIVVAVDEPDSLAIFFAALLIFGTGALIHRPRIASKS